MEKTHIKLFKNYNKLLFKNYNKLAYILSTVNPRVVKEIKIRLSSSCSSDMPFSAEVKIGHTIYHLLLGDMDDYCWSNNITYFFNVIKNSKVNYVCEPYTQYGCSGKIVWEVK